MLHQVKIAVDSDCVKMDLTGNLDKCTSFTASQRFVKSVGSKDVTFHEFTGAGRWI